ncbi:hypothetical protein ACV3QO_04835 [Clostridium perfringens]
MEKFWDYLSVSLISSGIGATVILGLSRWLGGVWSNRILEDEKQKNRKELEEIKKDFLKEIEGLKCEFQKEINKLSSINETATYISKTQYDKEFLIYQEIWGKLHECIIYSTKLYPTFENAPTDEEELEKYNNKKYSDFVERFNDYSMTIDKFAPFYKEDFYNEFINIRNDCLRIGTIFRTYTFDVKYSDTFAMCRDSVITSEERKEVYLIIPDRLHENKKKLQKEIREYLLQLKVID